MQGACTKLSPNAPFPMLVILGDSSVMLEMLALPANALMPILTTLDGTTMYRRLMHPENAWSLMAVTDVGILTKTKYMQSLKADVAISVALALICMFPEQHAIDGVALSTQPVVIVVGEAEGCALEVVGNADGCAVGRAVGEAEGAVWCGAKKG